MSQFIEMFKGDCHTEKWEDCLSITNGKKYEGEYQETGTFPICGSGGVMGYGESKLCDKDTVILGRKGNINSPIYMTNDYWIVDTAFGLDVDRQKLQPKYFFFWCKQFDFTKYNKQGVLPSLTKNDLLKIEMPIPPMELQNKFVAILEQADKSEFGGSKSQFIEEFGTIEQPKVEVKELLDVVCESGQYGSNTSATNHIEGTPRYIRITDIDDDGSLNEDIKSAVIYDDKYVLQKDDIVFARTGATVGKTYLHEEGEAIYAGYLIKYHPKESVIRPKYLKAYTHSCTYYNWVDKTQKVGAQPNISAAQYDKMPVLVPSLDEQDEYLEIYNQADKSENVFHKSIETIDQDIKSLINENL